MLFALGGSFDNNLGNSKIIFCDNKKEANSIVNLIAKKRRGYVSDN